ncbi:hypothetical protein DF185_07230 [Marinifilum breve]|uniref:DinB-like domain-containing protein n=1 Tax=Marinifilum breve TaxID=2184082 RepID=A0A2V4AEC4_9BACT|nr:DinB family protein [Marinifilum breve]PXY02434.1 hypothetical protein DF185_07230 [Marinifilum breve]
MEYTRKTWNQNQKRLRDLLGKESSFQEAIKLFLDQHARVHASDVSKVDFFTFEDELWKDMDDVSFRISQNKKGRTVAYGIWHSTRIEDITMNLLVAEKGQVIDEYKCLKEINSPIYDTGNALEPDEIIEFSKIINIKALRNYRKLVGKRTREIVNSLTYADLKNKVSKRGIEKIISLGAVAKDEKASWLIDFWGKKNIAGILLMPASRHLLVHINECMEAKKNGKKHKNKVQIY